VIRPLSQSRGTLIRSLHRKKGRTLEQAFLAEGERLLSELAADAGSVRWFFAEPDRVEWIEQRFPDAEILVVERGMRGLFATEHAQGIGAVIDIGPALSLRDLTATGGRFLLLDALADPGNVGTILRTADWFALDGVLLGAGCVDLYNPKVVRSTMGAIFRLPVVEEVTVQHVQEIELPIVALDGSASEMLGGIRLPEQGVFVIGNEAHGVAPEWLAVSRAVAIRGGGTGVESLNAAIAAGILCYELSRIQ
jgi:TrmH family RNA methyltransferase